MKSITGDSVRSMFDDCIVTGDFTKPLKVTLRFIRSAKFSRAPEIDRLRSKGVTLEIFDHLGRYDKVREVLGEDGERCKEQISLLVHRPHPMLGSDVTLLKQRVWMVIHFGLAQYRRAAYREALQTFQLCQRVCEQFGAPGRKAQFSAAVCRVQYCMGLVHRELFEYSKAKHHFTRSMSFAWRAPKGAGGAIAAFGHAKTLGLGLAWVHYIQGELELATPLLLAAKDLLSQYKEPLIHSYVDVIYASVERSANGSDPVKLNDAIRILERSHKVFERYGHEYYLVRAAHQLALAYIQKARNHVAQGQNSDAFECAKRFLDEMRERSHGSKRFECLALILESRIQRYQGKATEAASLAERALGLSELTFTTVEALVAHGEALFELGRLEQATARFEAALRQGEDNPKIRAVCHLRLACTLARQGDTRRASKHFQRWRKSLRPKVSGAFLMELEQEAQRILSETKGDFIVAWNTANHDPEALERELHTFLVNWAQTKSENDAEAAALLHISKQTLYNWKNAAK
jgi:tetratricopeptide (TPR) repeat protein